MRHFLLLSLIAVSSMAIAQTHVVLQTNNVYGSEDFVADNHRNYFDWSGNVITFSRADYYLSELELTDGTTDEPISDLHLLVKSNITEYYLGTTNLSTISSIKFGLGIDEPNNHLDPATYPSGDPLAHQTPDMHWGWSAGYKFVVLEGKVDNSGNGTANATFQFHCLDDDHYQANINVSAFTEVSNDTIYVKINVDHKGWIEQVNVPTAGVLHGEFPQTIQILDNSTESPVFRAYSPVGIDENTNHSFAFADYTLPFAPTIRYSFENQKTVDVIITDMSGRVIESANDLNPQGEFNVFSEPASGIYVFTFRSAGKLLTSDKFTVTR